MAASSSNVGGSGFFRSPGYSSGEESSQDSSRVSDDDFELELELMKTQQGKNPFFCFDDSELSPPRTKAPSSKKQVELSPVKKLEQRLITHSLDVSFVTKDQEIFEAGFKRLRTEIPDRLGKDGRSSRARHIFQLTRERLYLGSSDPSDPIKSEMNAVEHLEGNKVLSQTITQLAEIDSQAQYPAADLPPIQPFVDVGHIFNFTVRGNAISGGHHIPPRHDLEKKQFDLVVYPSGIYVASIKIKGVFKRASFFSNKLTSKQVLDVIRSSAEMACSNERRLCITDITDNAAYYIEVVRRGVVFKTAYPIVFVRRYADGENYEVEPNTKMMSAEVLLKAAKKLIQLYQKQLEFPLSSFVDDPIRYTIQNGFGEKEYYVELSGALYPEGRFDPVGNPRYSDWQKEFRAEFGDELAVSSVPKGILFRVPASMVLETTGQAVVHS